MKNVSLETQKPWKSKTLLEFYKSENPLQAKRVFQERILLKEDFFPMNQVPDLEIKTSSYIIHPESNIKLCWDILSMLLIIYQGLSIPVLIAFDVVHYDFWALIDLLIIGYFTVDIVICFNTGYIRGGVTVLSRKKIAKYYLKTWFVLDFLTIFPYDLIINGWEIDRQDMSNAAQIIRIFKFYRIIRLLRVVKLKRLMIEIEDFSASRLLQTGIMSLRMIVMAFFIAHWIACLWYYIAKINLDKEPETWISITYIENNTNVEMYIAALYWSFATMTTVGYGEIKPVTQIEYTYSIVAMAISCAMFAYVVGSIGGMVSKHSAQEGIYREKKIAINSYMREKGLPEALKYRIRRFMEYSMSTNGNMVETQILKLLSEPLKEQIYVETRGHMLTVCPIFDNFQDYFLLQLVKHLNSQSFAPNDKIIEEGQWTTTMYFVKYGSVEMFHKQTQCIFQEVEAGGYFGEIGFFTSLPRVCSAKCQEFVEVLMVSRDTIWEVLEQNSEAERLFSYYTSTCTTEDLSSLCIKCYFCHQVGHVAAHCPSSVVDIQNSNKCKESEQKATVKLKYDVQKKKDKKKKVLRGHWRWKNQDYSIINCSDNLSIDLGNKTDILSEELFKSFSIANEQDNSDESTPINYYEKVLT